MEHFHPGEHPVETLEEENARLRAEVNELRKLLEAIRGPIPVDYVEGTPDTSD